MITARAGFKKPSAETRIFQCLNHFINGFICRIIWITLLLFLYYFWVPFEILAIHLFSFSLQMNLEIMCFGIVLRRELVFARYTSKLKVVEVLVAEVNVEIFGSPAIVIALWTGKLLSMNSPDVLLQPLRIEQCLLIVLSRRAQRARFCLGNVDARNVTLQFRIRPLC